MKSIIKDIDIIEHTTKSIANICEIDNSSYLRELETLKSSLLQKLKSNNII